MGRSTVFLLHRGMLPFMIGVGVHIDELRLELVIEDTLAGIKPVVTGEHVAECAG